MAVGWDGIKVAVMVNWTVFRMADRMVFELVATMDMHSVVKVGCSVGFMDGCMKGALSGCKDG